MGMDMDGRLWLSLPQSAKEWYLTRFDKVNLVFGDKCTRELRFEQKPAKPASR